MPDTGGLRGDLAAFTEVMAGEAAGADVALAVEQIVGPVVYRLVIAGEAPRPDDVARMVDHPLDGIGADNRPVRRRPVR